MLRTSIFADSVELRYLSRSSRDRLSIITRRLDLTPGRPMSFKLRLSLETFPPDRRQHINMVSQWPGRFINTRL
jgi:hypothetical protein